MRWSRILLVFVVLCSLGMFFTVGCGSKDKCKDNTDCPVAQICRLDQVSGFKKCQTDFTTKPCQPACPTGQQCVAEKCVTICAPACRSDQACQAGKCVELGTCSPPCSGNQRCSGGTCVNKDEVANPSEPDPNEKGVTENAPNETTPSEPNPQDHSSPSDGSNEEKPTTQDKPGTTEGIQDQSGQGDAGTRETSASDSTPDQPAACTGCKANEQCEGGTCVAEQDANIGADCTTSKKCAGGLSCLEITTTQSRCLQTCKTSNDCAKNAIRKTCLQLTATENYCVQIASQGQKCGLLNQVQSICDRNSVCHEDLCKKPIEVKPQEACGTQGKVCAKDYLCLRFPVSQTVSYSYCMEQCKVGGTGNCKGGGTCERLNSTLGYCLPPGTAQHDDKCGGQTGGAKFDTTRTCLPGLSCVGLIQAICLKFANGDCATSKLTCPPNRKCQQINGPQSQKFSICSLVCAKDSDCGKTHMACDTNQKLCWPKSP